MRVLEGVRTVLKNFGGVAGYNFFFKVKKNNAGTRMSAYSLGCMNLTWRLKGF